ncbi:hypothetical protein [Methylobacterium sp. ARG-1]|uniref:hypothetical protein n=1 Tax=Methylobacterium sp. ARG-1 TaxID=1692501 RepID=UPI000682BE65|nr:hypothetical protein [Methylobacterium sp. ARG-1]KNY21728.1 hypothetical protein AKJ13_15980 [Methylobacterium sp. ARG-1]
MTKRLPNLDQISLDLMIAGTKAAGVRRTNANRSACADLQIAIREALRAVLPEHDPRRDPAYPFNQE